MTPFDLSILRSICSSAHSDFTKIKGALDAALRLETEGFCRVVFEDPACWRIYRSNAQLTAGMAALRAPQTEGCNDDR